MSSYLLNACRDDLAVVYAILSGLRLEGGLPAFFHLLNAPTRAASAFLMFFEALGSGAFLFDLFPSELDFDASFEQFTRSFEKSSVRSGTVSGVSQ